MVSGSGEIKPKTYVNIGANAFGKIVKLHVKEGDHVTKGEVLAQLENVQSTADVNANKASLQMAETDFIAAEAGLRTSRADLNRAQSDADHARLDWERAQGLYKDALIAKQDYDTKKAAWESAEAGLAQAQARVAQAKAQQDSAQKHISQNQANLARVSDVLQKTIYAAPYDGVVTNLPGARRGDGGDGNPERAGKHADDDRGYVGDYGGSEGRRDRHRERKDGTAGRGRRSTRFRARSFTAR